MADHLLRPWVCPKNHEHVLGMVKTNGRGVQVLMLYRQAVQRSQAGPGDGGGEIDVMAVVEGYVSNVTCSLCGAVRTWTPGAEAMRRMMERVRGEKVTG